MYPADPTWPADTFMVCVDSGVQLNGGATYTVTKDLINGVT